MKNLLRLLLPIMVLWIGNTQAQSLSVTINLLGTYGNNGINCCDSAEAIVTGGTGPYSYIWNIVPINTTSKACLPPPGTYSVTITDSNGNTATASIIIGTPFIATIIPAGDCCCEGVIAGNCGLIANAIPGTGSFSYSWSNGAITPTVTGLIVCPAIFTVIVTNGNGCTASQSISLPTGNCCKINCPDTVIICFDLPDSLVTLGNLGVDTGTCIVDSIWNNVLNIYEFWNNTVDNKSMFSHLDVGKNLIKWKVKFADGSEDSCTQVVIKNPPINAVIQFTANGVPAPTITTICLNGEVVFDDISTSMSPGKRGWLINDGSVPSSDKIYKHKFTIPGTWTITLTVYDDCNIPYTLTSTIIVDPAQGPELECYANVVCNGDTATYTCSNTCGTYNWTVTGGTIIFPSPINTTSNKIRVLWGNGTPQGKISLTVSGCTPAITCSNPSVWLINIVPPTLDIAGNTTVCQDLYESFSVTCIPGTNYDWTLDPSAAGEIISGQGDHEITVHWDKNYSGNATIHLDYQNTLNGCGSSDCEGSGCEGSGDLTVNVLPVFNITGPTKLCRYSAYSFTLSPATFVTWDILNSTGYVVYPNVNLNLYNWDLSAGKYLLRAIAFIPWLFCNYTATLQVEVISVPKPVIDGEILVCPHPASYTYTAIPNLSNVTYDWYIVGGDVATATGTSVTIKWNGSTLTHTISLKQTLIDAPYCESETDTISISLYDSLSAVAVTGPNVSCKQEEKIYSTGIVTNGTYSWSINPPAAGKIISGAGTNSIQVQWIEVTDPGLAYVKVKTSLCTADSDSIGVTVYALPDPVIVSPPDPVCINSSVTFSTLAPSTLAWTFPGSATHTSLTAPTVDVTYSTPGTYTVTLTETNAHSCSASNTIQIIVNDKPPIPVLTAVAACESSVKTYSFSPAAAFDGAIYVWSVADPAKGEVIASTITSVTVQWYKGSSGTNNLKLNVTSLCLLNTITNYPLAVDELPVPAITVPPNICVGGSKQFDGAPASASSYLWEFEDGTPATPNAQNTDCIFASKGTKTVTLTVTNGACSAKTSKLADVKPLPDISFTFIGAKTCSTIDGDIYITNAAGFSFIWDNNTFLSSLHITSYGAHTVTVTNTAGCDSTLNINIPQPTTCTNPPDPCYATPPVMSYTHSVTDDCSLVQFVPIITGAYVPGTISWDFGDGHTSPLPEHDYEKAGKYIVTLSVMVAGLDANNQPCEGKKSHQEPLLPVIIPIKPDFDVEYICNLGIIKTKAIDRSNFFGNTIPPTINTWDWFVDGGTTAVYSGQTGFEYPFSVLSPTNSHSIRLVISTLLYGGATCEITKSFNVPIPVVPSFTATPLCVGTPVQFAMNPLITVVSKVVKSEWNFGDPNQAGGSNSNTPQHVYTLPLSNPYTVTLTVNDAYGCTKTATSTITLAPPTVGSITSSGNPDPFIGCGSVLLTSNPFEPNTTNFSWSNGAAGLNINSITATKGGFYKVTVKPNPGCAYSAGPVTVTIKPLPEAEISGKLGYCPGEKLDLKTTSGYSYAWEYDSGSGWGPIPNAGNSSSLTTVAQAGAYRVTVTNSATGCSKTTDPPVIVIVDVPPSPLTILSSVLPNTAGKVIVCQDQTPFNLEPTAANATGYKYQWSNVAPPPSVSNTNRINSVTKTGKYTATITTTNNCIYYLDTIDVTVNKLPEAIIFGKQIYCEGDALELRGNAGVGLSYEWRKGGNTVGNTILLTIDPVTLSVAGTYKLRVTIDATGCYKESTINIIVNPTPLKPVIEAFIGCPGCTPVSPPLCADKLYTLSITPASQTPGLLPTDYTWSSNNSVGTSIPAYIADAYFVTAEKGGCKSQSDTISIHPIPDLSCVPTGCYELCDTCLPVTIPGPDGFTTYNWQRLESGNWVNYPPGNSKDLLITGITCYYYRLTVTNQWNCSKTSDPLEVCFKNCCPPICNFMAIGDRLWIDSNKDGLQTPGESGMAPTPVLLFEVPNLTVPVGSTTSGINGYYNFNATNVQGGIKQNTCYKIRIGVGFSNFVLTQYHAGFGAYPTKDNDAIFSNGWYEISYCTVNCPDTNNNLDFGFCEVPSTIVISVGNDNGSCAAGHSGEICVDASTCLTCSATDVFTYQWSNGATVSCIGGLSVGLYTVTVTDVSVGWYACPQTIYVDSLPSVKLSADCNNSLCAVAGGGCPNYTYQWSGPALGNSSCVSPVVPGTVYTVTVTDANGHSVTKSIMAPSHVHLICFQGALNCYNSAGSFGASILGGTPPFVTTLKKNGVPINSVHSNQNNSQLFNLTGAGYYCIYVTDANGCIDSCCANISYPVIVINPVITNLTCVGGNNGSVNITASGGTSPYSYLWNNGSTNANRTALTTGTYTVTVTDANGCTKTTSATLTALNSLPAQPTAITGPIAVCINTSVTYSTAAVAGATSYSWTVGPGATIISGQGSTTVTVNFSNSATNASLSVTANNLCGSSAARTLAYAVSSVVPGQPATITGQLSGLCNLASVAYSCPAVANATSYLWTVPASATILSGQGTNSITVKYTSTFTTSGTLSVIAQNGCGNSSATSRTINAKPEQPVISGQNWACKGQAGLNYSVAPLTGVSSYIWTIVSGSTLVSGQGTTSIVVNWGSINGVIYCVANNACGSSLQASKAVSFTCKEEGSLFDFSEINLFPNPTSTSATLQFEGFAEGKGELMVFDLVGKQVMSKALHVTVGDNRYQLDLASLAKGIYSIRVVYNGMTRNEKLIVQ